MLKQKMTIAALGFAVMMTANAVSQAAEFVTWRIDEKSRAICSKGGDSWTVITAGGVVTLDGPTGRLFTVVVSDDGTFTSPQEKSPAGVQWTFVGNVKTGEYTLENRQGPCYYRLVPKNGGQQAQERR